MDIKINISTAFSYFVFFYFVFNFFLRFLTAWSAFFIRKFSVAHQFHWSTRSPTWEDADFDWWYILPFLVMEKISTAKMDIFSAWVTSFACLFHLCTKIMQSCFNFYKQKEGWETLLQFSLGTVRGLF